MGWGDTTASTLPGSLEGISQSYYPPGCFYYANGNLYLNTQNRAGACSSSTGSKCLCTMTCQPGTYQDESGQTSCKTCPSGKSQPSSGKSHCQTNRRLSNTELKSVGDGPSIVNPQTIQNEQPVTAGEEIPKIENEKISSNLKNPIQQSTDEICEAWLTEKQERNVTNKLLFHRFALEQRQVVRSLESAARAGDKCTTAEKDAATTCAMSIPMPSDDNEMCAYIQALEDCNPSCYCDDPAADDAIKANEDNAKFYYDATCTLQCNSKSISSTGASSIPSSGTGNGASSSSLSGTGNGTSGVPLACAIYDTSVPSQWMGLIIGLLVALWLKDLLILRSLLDSTTIELKSTLDIVPTEWSEPWACYLNTEDEAKTANELLRGFGRSYSRKPKLRVLKI